MYKTIVTRRVRSMYAAMNEGDHRPLLNSFHRDFAYTFVGDDHPLAGTRRTRATMEAQLQRVLRLFPGINFTVREVVINGMPWNTRIGIAIGVRAELQDGSPYDNDIVQLLRMRWGRVTRVRTVIETARLTAAFGRLSAAGIEEATAPPVG
jgi:ketosteroid isomerase-like protein